MVLEVWTADGCGAAHESKAIPTAVVAVTRRTLRIEFSWPFGAPQRLSTRGYQRVTKQSPPWNKKAAGLTIVAKANSGCVADLAASFRASV